MIGICKTKVSSNRYGRRNRQFGVALPLVVIAMVAMLAIAGLALDSSHAFVNKTRLQNMADAAALAAAKVYDDTADTIPGTAAANSLFGINTDGSGNFEIDGAYDAGEITVIVQWSPTLNPFTPSGVGPYVRVIATGFNMATGFSAVIGIASMDVAASAVAGPSPTIDNTVCNIAPLIVCANDINAAYYGFSQTDLMVLKPSPGDHADVGPGNFKLLDLECEDGPGGGACVRLNMAGDFNACATTDETVETKPGATAGPSLQGFNTRFGEYNGPISPGDYPPDLVVHETSPPLDTYLDASDNDVITWGGAPVTIASNIAGFDYSDYLSRNANPGQHDFPAPVGVKGRRVLTMPVADCDGEQSGQSTLEVKGFACYFMLQQIGGGPEKNIFGQFVDKCVAGGAPGMDPGAGPGPYIIQLYKDPDSGDS